MTRQIEIAAECHLKWIEVKNKWLMGASSWTECRDKVQSVREIQLITKVQSVQGMQLTNMSTVQCRMCLLSYQQVVSSLWHEKRL
jgi:hypothetical protein